MSQSYWEDGLRLRLEELVDGYVVDGARHEDVFDAIVEQVGNLRAALELNRDPADDRSVIEEPAKDWPSAGRT